MLKKNNTIHERVNFHQSSQRHGESVKAFVRNLYQLAEHYDFGYNKENKYLIAI